jgi:signal transduction histidine kinase/DNA-binding response OmpR family regulator
MFLFSDGNDNRWFGTQTELYLRKNKMADWNKQQVSKLVKIENYHDPFLLFSQKNFPNSEYLWLYDFNGLSVFNPNTGFSIEFGAAYPEFKKADIKNINFDRYGNAWLSSELGLYRIKISKNRFKNYLNQPLANYDITTTFSCRGMTIMQEKLWVNGVKGKQYLIDLENNTKQDLPLIHGGKGGMLYFPVIKVDSNDFYTADVFLIRYQDGLPSQIHSWKKGEQFAKIWSIFKHKEKIWLGLMVRGLATLENDKITYYRKFNEFDALEESEVYHFYKWNEENILIAASNGIYSIHPEKGIVQRFWTGGTNETHIPTDKIYHINRDKNDKNILWVASAGGGLLKLTLDTEGLKIKKTEQFTVVDGLTNNVLYAVYPDDYQNLWIPSDYGLIQFNTISNTSKGYTTADGLPINEFNRISHYEADDGRLFFGTINGLTTFYPKDLLGIDETFDNPLRITEFKQFNGDKNELQDRTSELILNQKITLEPNDKFLTLNFALLEYNDASQIKYSYQIKKQSKEWIYLNGNELRLSGLPYGKFTLNVRAQGSSGQFSSQILSIPITVKRPFYLTWWFFSLIIITLIVGIYFWSSNRTRAFTKRQKELEQEVDKRTMELKNDKQIIEKQTEELKNLDKLKSRFFANVSHELRTPLTLIVAPVKEILSKNQLDKKTLSHLKLVERNSQRLQQMVNEILDLSKLEAGKMIINNETVHWYQFLKQTYASFDSLAEMKFIDYQFQYEGDKKLNIILDRQKVETVLNNLLSNAFKFTPNHAKVTMKAGVTEKHLWVEIHDTGRGIAPEDLPNIFNRFYQTKNKNQVAEGGTGIGLALTREIISVLKSSISVESEEGKETIFKIKLPLEIAKENEVVPMEEEIIEVKNQQSTISPLLLENEKTTEKFSNTILLVEDNTDLSLFITSILEEYYEVITASNGQNALEKLEKHPNIKLIISDVMMPVMDGFQLLEILKTSPIYQSIPVIMLTARASFGDKIKALRIGVDDYLTKPFINEELLARIDNLLQNAQGRKEANTIEFENIVISTIEKKSVETNIQDIETKEWLDNLEQVVLKNIAFSEFTVDGLAVEMFTSKRQLYRKIKQHIGITPLQYIKTYKLNHARDLLESKKVNSVKATAYSIGYPNVVYFRREFKKAFGRLPSDYLS